MGALLRTNIATALAMWALDGLCGVALVEPDICQVS